MRRVFGRTIYYSADGAGAASGVSAEGGAGATPAVSTAATGTTQGAAADTGATDRLAQLERELTEARGKLTAKEQAEAEAQRKSAEEQGNFKSLYEQTQTALKELQTAQATENARQTRLKAARAAGLDESLADRLMGADEAALLADAKALALRLVPGAPTIGTTNNGVSRQAAGDAEAQINAEWGKRGKRGGIRFG